MRPALFCLQDSLAKHPWEGHHSKLPQTASPPAVSVRTVSNFSVFMCESYPFGDVCVRGRGEFFKLWFLKPLFLILMGNLFQQWGYKNAEDSSSFLEQRDVCIIIASFFQNSCLGCSER